MVDTGVDTSDPFEESRDYSNHEIQLEGTDVYFLQELCDKLKSDPGTCKDFRSIFQDIDRALFVLLGNKYRTSFSDDIGIESRSEKLKSYRRANHWHLCAVPSYVKLSGRMLIHTRIVDRLEDSGLLGGVFSALVVFNVLLWVLAPAVTKFTRTESGWDLERCHPALYALHLCIPPMCAFILAHRVNRQLLCASMVYFETVVIIGAMFMACLVWIMHCRVNMGEAYDAKSVIQDSVLMVTKAPLLIFFAAPDSLAFRRKLKLSAMIFACGLAVVVWWHNRCKDTSWGINPNCAVSSDSDGLSAQQLYLAAKGQQIVFFGKGLLRMLFGNSFAVLRPTFYMYRQTQEETLQARMTKKTWSRMSVFRSDSKIMTESEQQAIHQSTNAFSHISIKMDLLHVSTLQSIECTYSSEGFRSLENKSDAEMSQELQEIAEDLIPLLDEILGLAELRRISDPKACTSGDTSSCLVKTRNVRRSREIFDGEQRIGCEPSILEISRRPLLKTSIGKVLARWRLLDYGPPFLALILILSSFAPKTELRSGEAVRMTWTWKIFLLNIVSISMLTFLIVHRVNRFLFMTVVVSYDACVISIASIVSSIVLVGHWWYVFGGTYFIWFAVWNVVGVTFEVVCLSNIDSWRGRETTRLIIYCFAVASYIRIAYRERCQNSDFLNLPRCRFNGTPGGEDLRNLYLLFWETSAVVFSKLISTYLWGETFAVYAPHFVPSDKLKKKRASDSARRASTREGIAEDIGARSASTREGIAEDIGQLHLSNDTDMSFELDQNELEAVLDEEGAVVDSINASRLDQFWCSQESQDAQRHKADTFELNLDTLSEPYDLYTVVGSIVHLGDEDDPSPIADRELLGSTDATDARARFSL